MADTAAELFEDETVTGQEAAVDAAIRAAGGEREAVRALLVQLGEAEHARAAAAARVSLGYMRGHQPERKVS